MPQQHRRHCRRGSYRVGTASGSDFGNIVPAFNGDGAWNKTDWCPPPSAKHSSSICEGCDRGMADCYSGKIECAS